MPKQKSHGSSTMTIVLTILIICLFLPLTHTIQIKPAFKPTKQMLQTHTPTTQPSIVIQTIASLMEIRKVPNNNQYQNCFSQEELVNLDSKVQQGLDLGRQLKQSEVDGFPSLIRTFLAKNFAQKTVNCFFGSNDLRQLMLSYNIQTLAQSLTAFTTYSYQNFPNTHDIFLTIINLIKLKDPQSLTSFIDKSLTTLFKQSLVDPQLDPWGIQAIDPQLNLYTYYGITNSNGFIGAVSDKQPFKLSKTVLAGAYDKYGRGRVDNIVETMNVMDMEVSVNGVKFPPTAQMNYRQYIDFKRAEFTGTYSILNKASVAYRYMALKSSPGVLFVQTTVTAHDDIRIDAKNYHRTPDYLNDVQKTFQNVPNKQIYRVISTKATTKTNKIDIVLSSTFFADDSVKKYLTGENLNHQDWDSNMHYHTLENIHVPKGEVFKFYLVSALISSQHHSDPKNEAIRLLLKVASTKPGLVVERHEELWEGLWQNDIVIEGNPEDQRTVRSMVYHFYSFINEFKSYGLSPMGLSGLGYNGHVFWDMDLWMDPAILILNPKLAKSLIEYRFDRLEAARNNAFLNGYKGVMFPWQSSKTGDEECPVWAAPGPLQHHISGTVALAAWRYYCVTKDLEWLKEKGRPIIEGVAEFWESRVEKDENGTYHINNVVAADEWAENIDDDAFTNGIAIESLRIANKMRSVLQQQPNPAWQSIRQHIIIHRFPDTNITRQYSTYQGQNIKQADANLLSYPLHLVTQKQSILNDLQYYQTRVPVEGTPAMTHAVFSLLYSRLGDAKNAYKWWKYSFGNNMLKPFGVLAETQHGTNPYFLTGAGGVLQAVVFGFAGVEITDQGVTKVQTVIPDEWDRVIVKSPVIQLVNQGNKGEVNQK